MKHNITVLNLSIFVILNDCDICNNIAVMISFTLKSSLAIAKHRVSKTSINTIIVFFTISYLKICINSYNSYLSELTVVFIVILAQIRLNSAMTSNNTKWVRIDSINMNVHSLSIKPWFTLSEVQLFPC